METNPLEKLTQEPAKQQPPLAAEVKPSVTWQASEFIHHEKESSWYMGVGAVALVLVVILFIFVDVISAIVVALMSVAFIMFAKRSPRVLNYGVGDAGVVIENKQYLFSELKSFSLRQESGFVSAQLIPVKRFMPAISIYFGNDDADKIVGVLAKNLPHEDREPDVVDRFFERLRF